MVHFAGVLTLEGKKHLPGPTSDGIRADLGANLVAASVHPFDPQHAVQLLDSYLSPLDKEVVSESIGLPGPRR